MGIEFNRIIGYSYKNKVKCLKKVSHKHIVRVLTSCNVQF